MSGIVEFEGVIRIKGTTAKVEKTLAGLKKTGVEFIERHADEPFFLYLSHYAVHTRLEGRPDLLAKYDIPVPATYAEVLAAARREEPTAGPALADLVGDAGAPGIARATALRKGRLGSCDRFLGPPGHGLSRRPGRSGRHPAGRRFRLARRHAVGRFRTARGRLARRWHRPPVARRARRRERHGASAGSCSRR